LPHNIWEVKEWATKKIGNWLIEMKERGELKHGGDRKSKESKLHNVNLISDIDITPRESSDSQLRAQLTDREFQAGIELKRKRRRR
jgi:hypothetical protein